MADWQAFEITVPGKDFLEPVRNVLETLVVYLEVLKTILNTIKTFLVDFGNPIKALVEALIRLIEELFLALKATGVFAYFDLPDFEGDPGLKNLMGGFDEWLTRFHGSLYDTADYCRPQPRTSTQSGFILIVVDSGDPRVLIARVRAMLRFLGKELNSPRWSAPQNVQAIPVGDSGDPILALADLFTDPPTAIQVKWTLPTSSTVPEPGFLDSANSMLVREFIPPSFLIEKCEVAPTQAFDVSVSAGRDIDTGKMRSTDPDDVGYVEYDEVSTFTPAGQLASEIKYKKRLHDDNDEPVVKCSQYIDISGVNITNILGQLGTFRYIDTDVEVGKTYYYRVRAYSGALDIDTDENMVRFGTLEPSPENQDGSPDGARLFRWPSTDAKDPVSMGTPSPLVTATFPVTDFGGFDVLDSMRHLFQAAFSLDFHRPQDDSGDDSSIGKGSLVNHAGPLSSFSSLPVLNAAATIGSIDAFGDSTISATDDQIAAAQELGVDLNGGQSIELPWQTYEVRRQATRLTEFLVSAMMASGGGTAQSYRQYMTGPLPKGSITGYSNLQDFVQAMTYVDENDATTTEAQKLYERSYGDASVRENVLFVVEFLKNFGLSGVPPNWVSVSLMRDIVPWSSDIIDRILAKIQALLDAFQGVIDEINAFIELLERKIVALEAFLKFLIDLLNFIESIQISASVLYVSGIVGGPDEWIRIINEAGGARPESNSLHLTSGVALAFVAPSIAKFTTAFDLIF